jgi:FAD/FMN-containing dehydrogenase
MALTLTRPDDPSYASATAGFNTAVTHAPDVVAVVGSTDDAVEAIGFAREQGMPVSVQATGHGAHAPVSSGMLVTTGGLEEIKVFDRFARLGAGTRWGAVVAAGAEQGLFPITGSAGTVGTTGLLLGGGVGPFARSHGICSDYLIGATVVTGSGEVVDASDPTHADLLWALRGGKYGLGLITELRVRLVPLARFYAGALFFAEDDIETALRGWIDWTAGADPRVTTSAAIVRFPPFDAVPAPFRGRRLLALRFAFPGVGDEAATLAAPLRAVAPVYLDALGEMPSTDVARIHSDPTQPGPSWAHGMLLDSADQDLATAVLDRAGDSPFIAVELRHLGEATRRDVEGGSAVGGRAAAFSLGVVGVDPRQFETELPQAAERLTISVDRWLSTENNANLVGVPATAERLAACWPADVRKRLDDVRRTYDPDGLFAMPASLR